MCLHKDKKITITFSQNILHAQEMTGEVRWAEQASVFTKRNLSINRNHLANTKYALKLGTRIVWHMELYSDSSVNKHMSNLSAVNNKVIEIKSSMVSQCIQRIKVNVKQSVFLDWFWIARPSLVWLAYPICKYTSKEQQYITQYNFYILLIHHFDVLITEQLTLKVFLSVITLILSTMSR